MTFLCPYTNLRLEAWKALREHTGHRALFRSVAGDAHDYACLVTEWWERGSDFALVEHDIVIRADVVEAFETCPEPWCAFPYEWTTNIGPALGCTRFRSALMKERPEAARMALREAPHFRQFGWYLTERALEGHHPHLHLPCVEHLNEEQRLQENPITKGWSVQQHLEHLGYALASDKLTAVHQ